jgi:2-succinyl-6-hydroxy-2,4-cyclohexadiene-1-carboxylate synthase
MPTASVKGIELHYRDVGEGFPVVLVHGFTGNSRNWALTIPALREEYRCISVDLRGHGLSAKPTEREDYTVEKMAGDVHALLDQLQIDECYLVGHSMGGMVSQQFVLDRPEIVRALVLVDTAAAVEDMAGYQDRFAERERLSRIAQESGMEAVFEEQLRLNPQRQQLEANPDFIQTWREQFLMTSPEAYMYGAHGMATRRPLTPELHRINVPTLIVCGVNDEPFLEPSRRMHEAIPNSELVMLEGAGHSPMFEAPLQFNEVLTGFLDRVHKAAAASA